MEVSISDGQSTPPVRGPSGQIDPGVLINESDGDDVSSSSQVTGVRVHIVMKEPAKLVKSAARDLEEVQAWRDKWARYFHEAKRTDVASATMETATLKKWNLLLCRGPGSKRLTDTELANLPAMEVADLAVAYLTPLKKQGGMEGLPVLRGLKGKAKFIFSGETYKGWTAVTSGIEECLCTAAQAFVNFAESKDNVEMATAFLDMFADMPFRTKLRNVAKQVGGANNVFKLWELAHDMLYATGMAEAKMDNGHEVLLQILCERMNRGKSVIRDGGGIVPKSTDTDTPKLPGRKCFACGSSERDHKWRECAERTDLTDAQKAAGAAAKAEAKAVRTGRPVKRSD
jgi:hypothetical protein